MIDKALNRRLKVYKKKWIYFTYERSEGYMDGWLARGEFEKRRLKRKRCERKSKTKS